MLSSISILWENFLVFHLNIFELPYELQVIVCRESPSENKDPSDRCARLEVQIFLRQNKEPQGDTNKEKGEFKIRFLLTHCNHKLWPK